MADSSPMVGDTSPYVADAAKAAETSTLPSADERARSIFLRYTLPQMRFLNVYEHHSRLGRNEGVTFDPYKTLADAQEDATDAHAAERAGPVRSRYLCTMEIRADGTYAILDLSGAPL